MLHKEVGLLEKSSDIPISINYDRVSTPIDVEIKNGFIVNIPVERKGERINLLNEIHQQNKFLSLRKKYNKNIVIINDFFL